MITAYPLIRHARLDAVIAFRRQRPITAEQFLRDVAALAGLLPSHAYVANLCGDRYSFTVGLAAALCRGQVSLLPPSATPGVIEQLAATFRDVYCLVDAAPPLTSIPCVTYPEDLGDQRAAAAPITLKAAQHALSLFTSGSTGRPTAHGKSWGTLVRSALAAGERLGIASLAGAAVVGTVPHQHSYGLESTVLLALQHGLAIQAERPLYAADVCASLDAVPRPRILVTTPVHLHALLAETGALPAADLVISATAPLSREMAAEAEARFQAPLCEIYGCSEAGQLATRRTARGAEWQCLEGVLLRQDDQGTWASGAPVETGTLLQDVIELRGAGGFLLQGRTADLVNVAGKRTSLAHLNHHLNAITGVEDGVFVMPDERAGRVTRLLAIVVAPGVAAETILGALRQRIDAAFLPRPLVFVESLPRNTLGKLPREALLRLAAEHGSR